jgi:hypothetical protein
MWELWIIRAKLDATFSNCFVPIEISPLVSVFDVEEFKSFLESLDAVDAAIVIQALSSLLPRSTKLNTGWIKRLPNDVCQLRLGMTRHKVLRILPEVPGLQDLPDRPMLIRVFFKLQGEHVVVLCAYNKLLNPSRDVQKQNMVLAVARASILNENLDK